MNCKWSFFLSSPIVLSLMLLVGCAGDRSVHLKYEPPPATIYQISSNTPRKIQVLDFEDKRADEINPKLIGSLTAAFNVAMGAVFSDVSVSETIRQAVKSELIQSGHEIVNEGEDIIIKGDVQTFWVSTETTTLYWDVVGEISIFVEIKKAGTDYFTKLGPYHGKAVERTYLNPSVTIIESVLQKSLNITMKEMFSDEKIISFFVTK